MPLKSSFDEKYAEFLDSLTNESIAFVFLSGHGFCEDEDDGKTTRSYYVPSDFRRKNKDEKKISIDDLMNRLATTPARFKWLCVDACRSTLDRGVNEKSLAISEVPQGLVLTQSCKIEQSSYELWGNDVPYENGLFTRAFVDAITGRSPEADYNRDGVVTMGEIRDYVETRVPSDAEKYIGGEQNPTFTTMKGVSFDSEYAQYPLFKDLPIFGHHPEEWREGQRLREEAEALAKQKKYREAGVKIQEAYRILPDVDDVIQSRERIKQLFYSNDPRYGARAWYEKATTAFDEQKYQEALDYINKASELDKNNPAYADYKRVIQSAMKNLRNLGSTELKAGALKTVTIDGIEINFRWCPPGRFKMGCPLREKYRGDDETQHTVVLTQGYWLAETETTQELWKKVMGQDNNLSFHKGDNLPVEQISWNDCQEFIRKLNDKTKDKGLQFSLPSEAHWEYACRTGTATRYSWGNDWDSSKMINKEGQTTPVGSYNPNYWGLKDMHGNVWEWCQDWYGDYSTGTVTDPTGVGSGSRRVLRGGGWNSDAGYCRSAPRIGYAPDDQRNNLGFRLELGNVK